ncbi:hypothetical protein DS2_15484 [Catenovulum agarivorans DS-2]|uniref:Uncharacterized protein n=1 Tax=Catenovulum agarivorans DS-2 TaxID=1328313 RepID=W7QL12_9ALTE|nr:hypothetical protein [Catenovulum agarivorans]EWH08803.1 hypothetical protein DS2_15484 [Catenovulum agarivorans DS-2]
MKVQLLKTLVVAHFAFYSWASHAAPSYVEQNGTVVIEAENFAAQHLDNKRRWHIFSQTQFQHKYQDSDLPHFENASRGAYIELLPDTRANHHETLVRGENFAEFGGAVAVLSYPVLFETPGRYYIWARAFSTGSEDNGVHFGLNNQWPESSARLQLCDGKDQWTWSSARRVPENHCGTPNTVTIDVPTAGVHNFMLSMREDGFELDKIILTQDKHFQPNGHSMAETIASQQQFPEKTQLKGILQYKRILDSSENFKYVVDKREVGTHQLTLVTLSQRIGQTSFQILQNGQQIASFTNPKMSVDNKELYLSVDGVSLSKNDIIEVKVQPDQSGQPTQNLWRALVVGTQK